jgi:hypothetical protein
MKTVQIKFVINGFNEPKNAECNRGIGQSSALSLRSLRLCGEWTFTRRTIKTNY